MSEKKKVKIRFRKVVQQSGPGRDYGRFDEYQVVDGRVILSRHDLESQAIEWCEKRGYGYEIVRNP